MRYIQDTYGRRILFINNNEIVQITAQRLRQGPSTTKGFWVPLLQRILYKLHQHNFALQVYVLNTLPKACIYTWWNKAISKVQEVETVKEIKVKCLTNLK